MMPTPQSPDPDLTRAHAAATRGDLRAATELYRAVLSRHPDSAEAHAALGQLLARAGQGGSAPGHLRRAAELEPMHAGHQFVLGKVLSASGDLETALAHYNKARWLDPGLVAAHVDATALLELRGDVAEARKAVARALTADPSHPRARVLAMRLEFRAEPPEEGALPVWVERLEAIAAAPDVELTRAMALDLLVDVLERMGDHAAAWDAMVRCNETDRAITGGALADEQQRRAYLNTVDAMAAFVTPERAAAWREACPDDGLPSPALLVGFPRSGTTLVERALDAHPAVRSIEERPTFELARNQIPQIVGRSVLASNPIPKILDALTPSDVGRLRRAYWEQAMAALAVGAPPEGELVLDKMPLRIADLAFVNRIFPDARVLVALRDPRDVCLSAFRQRLGYAGNIPMSFLLEIEGAARLYSHVMGGYLRAREAYTNPILEIRYERTVADFEARMREMLEFLGLAWDDAVLSFHERVGRMAGTPSYHAVRQRISTRAVGRWTRYETRLDPIMPTLRPLLGALGYTEGG